MASLITEEPWKPGARIGRYEILSKIAAGGMATVYLGRAHGAAGFERLVALKLCHAHLQEDAQAVERFLAEARLAARIHHPNVVATLDVVNEPTLCIAMEYVEGGSLASLIVAARDREARIPPPIALRIAVDLLAGLHAAHTLTSNSGAPLNLVHRDVTPQNVLVGVDGVARIADFGILKIEGQPQHTAAGNVRGKLPYLAPEQFESAPPTRQVDVHAAGVVLWEALAGARLFSGSDFDVAEQIRYRPRPSIRERVPELPSELDLVLARAMAPERGDRFESAAELAEALEKLPIALATTREVASFVGELLAGPLEERRRAAQHATAELTAPGAQVKTDEDPVPPERTRTVPNAELPTAVIRKRPQQPEPPRSRGAWLLAIPAISLAAAIGWFARARTAPEPHEVTPPPVPVQVVSPQTIVAPPPAAAPVAQPPPPPPPAPEHVVVSAPVKHEPPPEPARRAPARPHHKPKPATHAAAGKGAKPAPYDPDTL